MAGRTIRSRRRSLYRALNLGLRRTEALRLQRKLRRDEVFSYFAMRKIAVAKDKNGVPRLFLNNEPYFQNGLLDQGLLA